MSAAIDPATFDELKATTGAEFVVELVDTFLAEAPTMLDELRQALRTGDVDTFRRTAHSLKSNSSTFGATTLAALARELEVGGLDPVRSAAGAPLDVLEREFMRVAQALTELKHG